MISPALLALVRCPACRGVLAPEVAPGVTYDGLPHPPVLCCRNCDARYPQRSADYLDLRPPTAFAEQTKYLDKALHQDARHESVSPPLAAVFSFTKDQQVSCSH